VENFYAQFGEHSLVVTNGNGARIMKIYNTYGQNTGSSLKIIFSLLEGLIICDLQQALMLVNDCLYCGHIAVPSGLLFAS